MTERAPDGRFEERLTAGFAPDGRFEERLTAWFAPDVYRFGIPLFVVSGLAWGLGAPIVSALFGGLGLFVAAFFRNPERTIPTGELDVVSPADGRVIEVGEIETSGGKKALRIGIFLSVFNVHVNRAPVAGRVVSIERSGDAYLAAFNREAETRNVRCAVALEMADGRKVGVVQITGLIARRILCHPEIGEWLERGVRYGLIRFGSRTDVVLPLGSRALVERGTRVRGGSTLIAELEREETA
ncbi:MAG: phosphatidylserine decarboxylase family protein [bacterium]|nr:phosphatidylserine decarboxylase family protein [bacterium]MCP5070479.1 phosphatidylserine decarboxylase family protein [bacterium]